MGKEEYIMQLSMLEQQAREIQQQVGLVNQKIGELDVLKLSLNRLEASKEKEFLAPLGEGIFAKAILEDKELFVNVGSKIIVKKSIKDAEGIIDKQHQQLELLRKELEQGIEQLNNELQHIVNKARKEQEAGTLEETDKSLGDLERQEHTNHVHHAHEQKSAKKVKK